MAHIIFDCDGVLVDSEILFARALLRALRPLGYTASEAAYCRRFSGMMNYEIFQILSEELGHDLQADFVRDLELTVGEAFRTELGPIPGMPELVRRQPRPVAIVSNSPMPHVHHALDRAGLSHIPPQRIFSSDQVARPKPAPDLYHYALAQLALRPEEVWVVEDSPTGVQAAAAAGLRVIGFLGASHIFEGHDRLLLDRGAQVVAQDADALARLLDVLD